MTPSSTSATLSSAASFMTILLVSLVSIFIVIYTLAHYNVVNREEVNQCLMSWMYPNYVPLKIPESDLFVNRLASSAGEEETAYNWKAQQLDLVSSVNKKTPSIYEFYLYKESRNYDLELKGVPVLFLHGNSGSYKQARSIGVGTYLNEANLPPFVDPFVSDLKERFGWFSAKKNPELKDELLDIFSLDFKEELSGLHQHLIERQALYVNDAIHFILNSLYKNAKHKSVIIVAHSMGGLVARLAPMMPNYKQGSINTMLTFSTPHATHPLLVEESMVNLLTRINTYWMQEVENSSSDISNMAVVSIGSGFRDELIRDDMTRLTGILPSKNQISVSAYDIPGVRVACDHLSVVWCKQLIHVSSLALLKMVTHKNNHPQRFTLNLKERMKILRNVFIGSQPTALVTGMVHSIPSFDATNILESEAVANPQDIFGNVSAPLLTPSEDAVIIIDGKLLSKSKPNERIYAIDLNALYNSKKQKADSLSILSNLQFLEYQVYGHLTIGQGKNEHHKFFDLKEYAEVLPHIEKMDQHREVRSYGSNVAKSSYHLPLDSLVSQYGYKRLLIRVIVDDEDFTDVARIVFHAYDSNKEGPGSASSNVYLWLWDYVVTLFKTGTPFTHIGEFKSPTQKIRFPNLSRHHPYRFRITPKFSKKTCSKHTLSPTVYYVASNQYNQRVEERWVSTTAVSTEKLDSEAAAEFMVKFSASNSDMEGFSMMIHTDPCWTGYTLEAQVAWSRIISYVVYFHKNYIISMVFMIALFVLSFQNQLNFSLSAISLMSQPAVLAMILIPFSAFAAFVIPKLESIMRIFVFSDPIVGSILFPESDHMSSPLYLQISFLLAWFVWYVLCLTFDLLITILSWTVFLIPSHFVYQMLSPPTVRLVYGFMFRVCVLVAAAALYKLHSGICLALVLIAELVYCCMTTGANRVRRAFVMLTVLHLILHVSGAILWIFDMKHRVESGTSLPQLNWQEIVDFLPHASFANDNWYHVLPLFWNLLLFFPENDAFFSFSTMPFYFASFFMVLFCAVPYYANYQLSIVMMVNLLFVLRNKVMGLGVEAGEEDEDKLKRE